MSEKQIPMFVLKVGKIFKIYTHTKILYDTYSNNVMCVCVLRTCCTQFGKNNMKQIYFESFFPKDTIILSLFLSFPSQHF